MIVNTLNWIYLLVLFSDTVFVDYEFKKMRPTTWPQYALFVIVFVGYAAGLCAIIGHELLHRSEIQNKIIGSLGFTQFMYTHFFDEHLRGHHKTLGTPADPATARKGQSVYSFVIQSGIGSHLNVWKMETKRIKQKMGNDVSLSLIIFNNKMTYYWCSYITILSLIYFTLGWNSLKF